MGKIRKALTTLLFMIVVSLTACAGTSNDAEIKRSQVAQEQEETIQSKQEENEQDEEIPNELLPRQNTEENRTNQSETMEVIGEDGTVYITKESSDSSSGISSDTKETSGNHDDTETNDVTGKIQIDFSIESSNADGSVSYAASMTLDKGASVYDALKASGVSHSGKNYVSAIGGLSEGMFGAQSGWKYYVNGVAPNTSCVNYVLQDGDKVQWSYVRKP